MEHNNDDSKNNNLISQPKATSATLTTNSTREHKNWAEIWADKKIISKATKEVKKTDDGSSTMAIKPTENWADRWTNNNERLKPSSKAHSSTKMSSEEDAAKSKER
jgi:hypothetical protein